MNINMEIQNIGTVSEKSIPRHCELEDCKNMPENVYIWFSQDEHVEGSSVRPVDVEVVFYCYKHRGNKQWDA